LPPTTWRPYWLDAPASSLDQKRSGTLRSWAAGMAPMTNHRATILSCPCPGVQRTTRADCTYRTGFANEPNRAHAAFHGVPYPTTLEETSSDLRRAFLTRLCSVFNLSQTLDALLRPQPFPPCFMRITPLGFHFQRFSLPGSRRRLTTPPVPHAVSHNAYRRWRTNDARGVPRLQGFEHPESPFRQARCYPRYAGRSSPSITPLRGIHPSGLGFVLPRGLLSWAFASR